MRLIWLLSAVLLVSGCSETPKPTRQATGSPSASADSPLQPLLMAQRPANAISVTEAMKRKAGETVTVIGQVPPEKVQPYNPAVAAFVMLAPETLQKEEVKEEFDCDDAAT